VSNSIELSLNLVKEILVMHDVGCVFELDAPRRIHERLMAEGFRTAHDVFGSECDWSKFHQCFVLSEIYCPHEGIDRRAEYGMLG
jgi:hypothetical protein